MNEFVSGKSERVYSWYQPSLPLRGISPRGRDEFGLCVRGNGELFLALPLGELAFAEQMTERANKCEQVRMRVNLSK